MDTPPTPLALKCLRFMTCGSVDDGKSTLIGRLLYDCQAVYDDHLREAGQAAGIETGADPEFSFLVDGLRAEREQGITIDVAYRYFSTDNRAFIIADAPGHEQYTRNQAAAASHCDVAIVLVSASTGLMPQTRRHIHIAALFGVKSLIIAINKMDMHDYSQSRFDAIKAKVQAFTQKLNIVVTAIIPICAKTGDNVVGMSPHMPWYQGPYLLEALESWEMPDDAQLSALRLPIQMVIRDETYGRLYLGTLASGTLTQGMEVTTAGAGASKVSALWNAGNSVNVAHVGDSVAIALSPPIDITRGAVVCTPQNPAAKATQIYVHIVGLTQTALQQGREYDILCGTATSTATLSKLEGVVDLDSLELQGGRTEFGQNDIVKALLVLSHPIVCTPFQDNKTLGAFILIDRLTQATLAAGVIDRIERNSEDVPWQNLTITPKLRAQKKAQIPFVIWFTGLSGAGKSTIANALEKKLFAMGKHTYVLDGDNLRNGLTADLGFTTTDRIENMRRVAHTAKLFLDAGVITLVSLISPFEAERQNAKTIIGADHFCEIWVDTPLAICQQRDPKNLYKKAGTGEIQNFTGISAGYEAPAHPDITLHSADYAVEALVEQIMAHLAVRGWVA